ncbi:potassium channel protein [Nitrogeniibacter mangrovi]|uniref:Potassium channel protein n=1 Tax=Nitrogeniibacter mangrovi TaxID=2016596 RepID=A0A6C1B3H4_9RHOO|nr:potassium channel protein [Nitrogeniibacter mangrovi]QID18211.1 potassium channel protein [Nitrogeniibacter mangrovi]
MNRNTHLSTLFLAMRRLRAPLITLIVIYGISVLGLSIIPGADGQPMSFFHAFYFISYTATTIGFGEIPGTFSEPQRLWVLICIYLAVVGWAYTLGALFSLLQDGTFREAVSAERFGRAVRRLHEPFYLVCGYGETGRRVCRALDQMGLRSVVLETAPQRVGEVDLHNYLADIPVLRADASHPDQLRQAGLGSPHCQGVLALTNDDRANLAVAISARLLAPQIPALCRAESAEVAANMASFGTRHIINPYEKFADYLAQALHAPNAYHLLNWLTGPPGTCVERHRDPPRGKWIVCGYGDFGRVLVDAFDQEDVPVTIIDRDPAEPGEHDRHRRVRGDGTGAAVLERANIDQAAGIVASTGDDMDNLSIVMTARELNPDLFVILRMNHFTNHELFEAFAADATVVPSQIIANECLAVLTTPLLERFLEEMRQRDDAWAGRLLERLTGRFGWMVPSVWSVRLTERDAPALHTRLQRDAPTITLGELLRSPHDRNDPLDAEVLYLCREGSVHVTAPAPTLPVCLGDELLLVGRRSARAALALTLENIHSLAYVLTGAELPGGLIWERIARWRQSGR